MGIPLKNVEKAEDRKVGRPISLTIFSILLLLMSVVTIILGGFLIWLFSGKLFLQLTAIAIIIILIFAAAVVELISSIALLQLKQWAWSWTVYSVSTVIVCYVALIASIAALGAGISGIELAGALAGLGAICLAAPLFINVMILVYCFSKEAKALFKIQS